MMTKHLLYLLGTVIAIEDETKKIYLNTTNLSFGSDLVLDVQLEDKIDIFCPLVDTFEETLNSPNPLFLTLWAVDKESFDDCNINGVTSKRLLRCTVPNYEKKFTIIAKRISALPGSLLFEEGKTYYFIVPNFGRELEDIEVIDNDGGLCQSHNIKFAINVREEGYTETINSEELVHPSPEEPVELEIVNLGNRETSQENQLEDSWQMWFGVLIGASIVMVIVLCSLCVIFLFHRRQSPKNLPESNQGTFFGQNMRDYENMTIIKEGNRQTVTIERRKPLPVGVPLRPKSFSSNMNTHSSTRTEETTSLIEEPCQTQNEIQWTPQGPVVLV